MSDLRILQDMVDREWWRRVRVMAPKAEALDEYPVPAHAPVVKRFEDEIHLHHLQAAWPVREAIARAHPFYDGELNPLATWSMVGWWIGEGGKVSRAMADAGVVYALTFGVDPGFAFIRHIPTNAQEFVEVQGITLVRAAWVPMGFIAVANGGSWRGLPTVIARQVTKEVV